MSKPMVMMLMSFLVLWVLLRIWECGARALLLLLGHSVVLVAAGANNGTG